MSQSLSGSFQMQQEKKPLRYFIIKILGYCVDKLSHQFSISILELSCPRVTTKVCICSFHKVGFFSWFRCSSLHHKVHGEQCMARGFRFAFQQHCISRLPLLKLLVRIPKHITTKIMTLNSVMSCQRYFGFQTFLIPLILLNTFCLWLYLEKVMILYFIHYISK